MSKFNSKKINSKDDFYKKKYKQQLFDKFFECVSALYTLRETSSYLSKVFNGAIKHTRKIYGNNYDRNKCFFHNFSQTELREFHQLEGNSLNIVKKWCNIVLSIANRDDKINLQKMIDFYQKEIQREKFLINLNRSRKNTVADVGGYYSSSFKEKGFQQLDNTYNRKVKRIEIYENIINKIRQRGCKEMIL